MSKAHEGRKLSSETKVAMSAAVSGINNPIYGKGHLISGSNNHISVVEIVNDIFGNTIAIFPAQSAAAKWLGTTQPYVHRLLKSGKVF